MNKLFGKRTIIDRLGEAVGLRPKRSATALRSGLAAAGAATGLAVVSAVVSALRDRQSDGSQSAGKRDGR
jgi:crotonobetainyl-CoA:carnitine CoA-transferase CaiB-like acyl-CoA transferase